MNNNISFGPLLTPARDIRKRSKAVNTFQLTIKNRLGAALKFANGCDNNLALGVEAIKVIENDSSGAQSSEYVPCPLCCRENLPLSQFGNMIPSDDDSSAAAHYMFCCRPSSNHNQLHWHTQHCCTIIKCTLIFKTILYLLYFHIIFFSSKPTNLSFSF